MTTKKVGPASVQDAACSTRIANAAPSEVALFVNHDAAKPTVTVALVGGNAMTEGDLDSIINHRDCSR